MTQVSNHTHVKGLFGFVFIIFLMVMSLSVKLVAEDNADVLKNDLSIVEQQLEQVQQEIQAVTRELWTVQHDLEYEHPECVAIHNDIKELEKQLIDKRKQLNRIMAESPEMKQLNKQRQELFEKVKQLTEEKTLIQNEMRLENRQLKSP